jgi:hypothetical protein
MAENPLKTGWVKRAQPVLGEDQAGPHKFTVHRREPTNQTRLILWQVRFSAGQTRLSGWQPGFSLPHSSLYAADPRLWISPSRLFMPDPRFSPSPPRFNMAQWRFYEWDPRLFVPPTRLFIPDSRFYLIKNLDCGRENQIIESASSVGAALGGRAEYAAPDGAGFVLEWRRYKDSAPTVLCFL